MVHKFKMAHTALKNGFKLKDAFQIVKNYKSRNANLAFLWGIIKWSIIMEKKVCKKMQTSWCEWFDNCRSSLAR